MRELTSNEGDDQERDAAYDFIKKLGVDPTPDAIGQLAGPFAEALRIMCTRGYDPDGRTWKLRGWKGLVHDILDNAFRLRYHSWHRSTYYPNGALDIINFAGFYYRQKNEGKPWGEMGEPG